MSNIKSLQAGRAIAAILVLLYHNSWIFNEKWHILPVGEMFGWGDTGVQFFFVLSGFIMFVSTSGRRESPGEFLLRRASRVVPVYWIVTIGLALIALTGGQIQFMHTTTVSAEAQIRGGRVRVIAVAANKRLSLLPDVPTLAESGIKDAEAIVWFGMSAPAKTPRPIIDKLNRESNRLLGLPDVKKRFDELGLEIQGGTPEEFQKFIRNEVERLNRLIQMGALTRE